MLRKGFLFLLLIALTGTAGLQAQALGGVNFQNLNADELTDTQLRQINREIEERGLNMQQFEQLAVAQGAQPTQVRRMVSRLQEARLRGEDPDRMLEPEQPTRETRFVSTREDEMDYAELPREEERDSLHVFGMELFDRVTTSFEPSFNVPTPQDFRIGPGDQLVIDVWGAAEMNYRLLVDAEGNIRIANLGPIQVSGMTIEQANSRIIERLSDIYSGLRPANPDQANTWAHVSLGNIRSIKVTVTGEVARPGTYNVSSLSTLFNALYAAGGPNRSGTFRNVQLLRRGEPVHTFDLYDFLIHGDQSDNIRLKDEDIIKVDPYINRVHVWGEMKRVGFFELREGETLGDLVQYAAGFTDNAYTRTVTLRGPTPTMRRIHTVLWPEGADTPVQNGDRLRVGQLLERYENLVRICGAVFRPGDFQLEEGMTLYDLIAKADGLREDASLDRGVIERRRATLEPEILAFSVERLMEDPARYDIPLRRDDIVRISSILDLREEYSIRVTGAVHRSRTFEFRENMTVEDAIFLADGFRDEAAAYRIEVARRVIGTGEPDQYRMDEVAQIYRFHVDENLGFREQDADFRLMPFDQVYVRTQPNYQRQQTVRITGEVQYPGEYVISSRDARLSDLVEWAGGLSAYAFPSGASLERILDVTRVEITELDDEDPAGVRGGQQQFARDTLTTPVGIRLADALAEHRSIYDLILEPGDELHIPKQLQTVRVEGEVLSPTSIRYDPSRSFSDYLSAAGGVTEQARRNRAYVVYPNGEIDRTKRFLVFRNNPSIEPGATIIVPARPERREMTPQERISLASSIASTALIFITLIERL